MGDCYVVGGRVTMIRQNDKYYGQKGTITAVKGNDPLGGKLYEIELDSGEVIKRSIRSLWGIPEKETEQVSEHKPIEKRRASSVKDLDKALKMVDSLYATKTKEQAEAQKKIDDQLSIVDALKIKLKEATDPEQIRELSVQVIGEEAVLKSINNKCEDLKVKNYLTDQEKQDLIDELKAGINALDDAEKKKLRAMIPELKGIREKLMNYTSRVNYANKIITLELNHDPKIEKYPESVREKLIAPVNLLDSLVIVPNLLYALGEEDHDKKLIG